MTTSAGPALDTTVRFPGELLTPRQPGCEEARRVHFGLVYRRRFNIDPLTLVEI
jgi:hypothetical protein